jgi:hypothetical protein
MNKVFIIGLPRTGTTSISVALLDYGFKVAHTASTKRAFELADVISDAPCFSDYKQLDTLFPDSKFVYLERELTSWQPSIQRLLTKMQANLDPKTGHFNPVLKRSFREIFGLLDTEGHMENSHLEACYLAHQNEVFKYFANRNDLLKIDISQESSLQNLLSFLEISALNAGHFPKLNVGKQVDSWKEYKHPGKVNSNSAGKEHRKFFDYV